VSRIAHISLHNLSLSGNIQTTGLAISHAAKIYTRNVNVKVKQKYWQGSSLSVLVLWENYRLAEVP